MVSGDCEHTSEQPFEERDVQPEGAREARDGAAGADGDAVADEDEMARRGAQSDEELRLEDVLGAGRGVGSELWCAAKWGAELRRAARLGAVDDDDLDVEGGDERRELGEGGDRHPDHRRLLERGELELRVQSRLQRGGVRG